MKIASVQFPVFNPYKVATAEIYVSGCTRNCCGCHNPELANFEYGEELDIDKLITRLNERKELFKAISISGGDLLCHSQEDAFKLAFKLKGAFPDKEFWLFTGENEFSNIPTWATAIFDVIKYGKYMQDLKQDCFPASSNQKIWKKNA